MEKRFYKTEWFKCIAVLLIILLLSGSVLTVASGFMEVSDTERTKRAVAKIYGREADYEEIAFNKDDGIFAKAEIVSALKVEGDYLIQSKGYGGWSNTVTCWALIDIENGRINKVAKVVIGGSDGETLLNNIDYLDKFTETEYVEGFEYTAGGGFVTSGATMSSNAIDNGVNGAISFALLLLQREGENEQV